MTNNKESALKHETVPPARRYVYLAGPVEIQDTWRERAAEKLAEINFEAINPIRGEQVKTVGKHIESDIPDALLVSRDLNDLERTKKSAGIVLMNLSTTKEGRKPIGTLLELQWCWDNNVPVIAVMGRDCGPNYKHHPWINRMVSAKVSSVNAALELIEKYFI